ncbi:hypothetical protein [Methylobacterium iners]|uniref:Uncharacterized protein n=1 Tax=Methylobacterium iners TaxID=418707 RepID=A0ABQ4S4A8_9HYPH|nr:hypothetical protein [Methylobacterium iners]GJD97303.1 hypothetical protein OCOJLMKI_4532 [Methylobacterium iners]
MSTTDIALVALQTRDAGSKPGTRGPHLNLFSGGLPKVQKAEAAPATAAERVEAFAKTRKMTADATKVLTIVVESYERTGTPVRMDGFEIAAKTGLTFERVDAIRSELLCASVLRVRSDNPFGIDGLIPGDAWNRRP